MGIVGAVMALRAAYVMLLPPLGGTDYARSMMWRAQQMGVYSIVAGLALACGLQARHSEFRWVRGLGNVAAGTVGVVVAIVLIGFRPSWAEFISFWSRPFP